MNHMIIFCLMSNFNRTFYSSIRCVDKTIVQKLYIGIASQDGDGENDEDDEVCLICYDNSNNSNDGDNSSNNHSTNCRVCGKIMHICCLVEWFEVNIKRICPHCRSGWKFSVDIVENGSVIMTTICSIAGDISYQLQ